VARAQQLQEQNQKLQLQIQQTKPAGNPVYGGRR
jgi:hypothetical protein